LVGFFGVGLFGGVDAEEVVEAVAVGGRGFYEVGVYEDL
jgi:hypothetical protein